jgi:hypothetical protein
MDIFHVKFHELSKRLIKSHTPSIVKFVYKVPLW